MRAQATGKRRVSAKQSLASLGKTGKSVVELPDQKGSPPSRCPEQVIRTAG